MASGSITSWQIDGETMETVTDFIFLGSKITVDGDSSYEIKRCLLFGRKGMTNLDSILKSRDITLPAKVCLVKAVVFPVVMYRCESWKIKKRLSAKELMTLNCGAREDFWEFLRNKEIKPVNSKENQSWVFTGRTDAEVEAPVLWPPDANSQLIGKYPDAGKDGMQEEKGMTGDEIVGWYHWRDGHESEQTPGWWRTRKPGMLQPMGWQRFWHDWATEQQQSFYVLVLRTQMKQTRTYILYSKSTLIFGTWVCRYSCCLWGGSIITV